MNWIGPALLFYGCLAFVLCAVVGRFLAACRDLHEAMRKQKEDGR